MSSVRSCSARKMYMCVLVEFNLNTISKMSDDKTTNEEQIDTRFYLQ